MLPWIRFRCNLIVSYRFRFIVTEKKKSSHVCFFILGMLVKYAATSILSLWRVYYFLFDVVYKVSTDMKLVRLFIRKFSKKCLFIYPNNFFGLLLNLDFTFLYWIFRVDFCWPLGMTSFIITYHFFFVYMVCNSVEMSSTGIIQTIKRIFYEFFGKNK